MLWPLMVCIAAVWLTSTGAANGVAPANGGTTGSRSSGVGNVTPAPANRSPTGQPAARHLQGSVTIAMDDPGIEWYGRRVTNTNGAVDVDFAGVAFACQVTGTAAVHVEIQGLGTHYWRLHINDTFSHRFLSSKDREFYQLADGLNADDTYVLHLMKLSEAADDFGISRDANWVTVFRLTLDATGSLVPFASRPNGTRRVEFLGDSITWGFGTLVGKNSFGLIPTVSFGCDGNSNKFYASSNYEAYSNKLCRALGADCRYIAWGGMGLVSNNDKTTDQLIGDTFLRSLGTRAMNDHDFASWVPHLVFINIGQNDVTAGASMTSFQAALEALVRTVRSKYSTAVPKVVLACGPMQHAPVYCPHVEAAANRVGGDVLFLDLRIDGAMLGCTDHPSHSNNNVVVGNILVPVQGFTGWVPSPSSTNTASMSVTATRTPTITPFPSFGASVSPTPTATTTATTTASVSVSGTSAGAQATPTPSRSATRTVSTAGAGNACDCVCGGRAECCPNRRRPVCDDSDGGGGGLGLLPVVAGGAAVLVVVAVVVAVVTWNRRHRLDKVRHSASTSALMMPNPLAARVVPQHGWHGNGYGYDYDHPSDASGGSSESGDDGDDDGYRTHRRRRHHHHHHHHHRHHKHGKKRHKEHKDRKHKHGKKDRKTKKDQAAKPRKHSKADKANKKDKKKDKKHRASSRRRRG